MGDGREAEFLEAPDSLEVMVKQFIVPLAKNSEAKKTTEVVSLLKALAYCYSISKIDRQKICGEIVDKFQEYDSNIYSIIIDHKIDGKVKNYEYYVCYRIADKDFLESVTKLALNPLSLFTGKIKLHIDAYGSKGEYGGIGFEITPKPEESN
jgi:hypothetical protein